MQKQAKIVVLDNNDSFTFNLVDLLRKTNGIEPIILKHDSDICTIQADAYIFSPGPGLPKEKPLMKKLMDLFFMDKPILGVCLGHQFIAEYFGASLKNLGNPLHGIKAEVNKLKNDDIFNGINFPFQAALYHSWAIDVDEKFEGLEIIASFKGIPMAIKHSEYNIYGFQFHPESFLTLVGEKLISNWLKYNVYPFMTD